MTPVRYVVLAAAVVALVGAGAFFPGLFGPASPAGSGSSTTTGTVSGSFYYSPASPVQIVSVTASKSLGADGTLVSFDVAFKNVGSSDVYAVRGCGSSLTASVGSSSGVLRTTTGGPICLCAEAPVTVPPGGNSSATTPGCWSAYKFLLVGGGSVQVDLSLHWGPAQSTLQDVTNVTATFVFA